MKQDKFIDTTIFPGWMGMALVYIICGSIFFGCATASKKLEIKDIPETFLPGTIISTKTGKPVSFEALVSELAKVQVIYIGEQHTNSHHHDIQLKVIRELFQMDPQIKIGMEMFDRTYQPILDQWSNGKMDRLQFLQKTHWYANWKFKFELYHEILDFIKERRIHLVGLNIPFHIPRKIATGGIRSLSADDTKHLPQHIDTSNAFHRAYVKEVFKNHLVRGRENFEFFYMAQCVWEEIMAESIALNLKGGRMIVLAGNGHIIKKFGVPDRAYHHTRAAFKTIYPASSGSVAERSYADYIWVTPGDKKHAVRKMPTGKK